MDSGIRDVIITTDDTGGACGYVVGDVTVRLLNRPAELAQDDTPMIAVVQQALQAIPGQPDDIIVLLQPTQPLRKPEHVQEAVRLLRETSADSVVSVVPLPLTHSPELVLTIESSGSLMPYFASYEAMSEWQDAWSSNRQSWADRPACRQDARVAYKPDGTVYAFWRKTVETRGTIYGQDVRPLIIDPEDSCELDTEDQWAAVEQRWKERHG